jgi:hypothetical protein
VDDVVCELKHLIKRWPQRNHEDAGQKADHQREQQFHGQRHGHSQGLLSSALTQVFGLTPQYISDTHAGLLGLHQGGDEDAKGDYIQPTGQAAKTLNPRPASQDFLLKGAELEWHLVFLQAVCSK